MKQATGCFISAAIKIGTTPWSRKNASQDDCLDELIKMFQEYIKINMPYSKQL
jgi:hypothetical protein